MITDRDQLFMLPVGTTLLTKSGVVAQISVDETDNLIYRAIGFEVDFDLEYLELPAEILHLPLVERP